MKSAQVLTSATWYTKRVPCSEPDLCRGKQEIRRRHHRAAHEQRTVAPTPGRWVGREQAVLAAWRLSTGVTRSGRRRSRHPLLSLRRQASTPLSYQLKK